MTTFQFREPLRQVPIFVAEIFERPREQAKGLRSERREIQVRLRCAIIRKPLPLGI